MQLTDPKERLTLCIYTNLFLYSTMNIPRLLVLASLMSLALITGTAVTSMPSASYAQANNATNANATNANATNANGAHFSAVLNGENVFPPVKTNATGKAELTLLGDQKTMSYKVTGGPVDNVGGITISHCCDTGGRPIDVVVLRSGTQQGLSGQAKTATLTGNFTSADILPRTGVPRDIPSLVRDILAGNVIIRVDTLNNPLGIVAGKLKANL